MIRRRLRREQVHRGFFPRQKGRTELRKHSDGLRPSRGLALVTASRGVFTHGFSFLGSESLEVTKMSDVESSSPSKIKNPVQ